MASPIPDQPVVGFSLRFSSIRRSPGPPDSTSRHSEATGDLRNRNLHDLGAIHQSLRDRLLKLEQHLFSCRSLDHEREGTRSISVSFHSFEQHWDFHLLTSSSSQPPPSSVSCPARSPTPGRAIPRTSS